MTWRRLITIPGYLIWWSLWIVATPLWASVAVVVDVLRRSRGVALRSGAVLTVYLSCEVVGIVTSGLLWLWKSVVGVEDERWRDIHFGLEAWWGTTIFRAVVFFFALRVDVESDSDLGEGPYLLLVRHASTADTLLASALVSRANGLRLRYVLKRELLWDPCLDIVGHRTPNVFIDRSSRESDREVQRLQQLARDLGPRDGILIYPEGTRSTENKRRRVVERFREKGDTAMFEYARSLACVLPPRLGGSLGLLEHAPTSDVVLCEHTGFEGAASLGQIWTGSLLRQVIHVRFRRIAREDIPTERDDQATWLLQEWQRVDAWLQSHQLPDLERE